MQRLSTDVADVKEAIADLKGDVAELTVAINRLMTQHELNGNSAIIEELATIKQESAKNFEKVQQTLKNVKKQVKNAVDLETLRTENGQLAETVGKNLTDIKEGLIDTNTGLATMNERLLNLETSQRNTQGNLASHKNRSIELLHAMERNVNTSFASLEGGLQTLKNAHQKTQDNLNAFRSESRYMGNAIGRNLTTIEEKLSSLMLESDTDLAITEGIRNLEAGQQSIQKALKGKNSTESVQYLPTSCREIVSSNNMSGFYLMTDANGVAGAQYCYMDYQGPNDQPHSCSDIAIAWPSSPSGYYWVRNTINHTVQIFCDMSRHCCGSSGASARIAYLDMTDPTHMCPSGFAELTGPRRCSSSTSNSVRGCRSIIFPAYGISYRKVCGKIIGYQKGTVDALSASHLTINEHYVDGISVTHGQYPNRQHIWTFVAAADESSSNHARCPCSHYSSYSGRLPHYIGNDYFCDSGTSSSPQFSRTYAEDPLWDGSGCSYKSTCCTFNSPPWFCKHLSETTDDIEVRVCRDEGFSNEDVQLQQIELYIR